MDHQTLKTEEGAKSSADNQSCCVDLDPAAKNTSNDIVPNSHEITGATGPAVFNTGFTCASEKRRSRLEKEVSPSLEHYSADPDQPQSPKNVVITETLLKIVIHDDEVTNDSIGAVPSVPSDCKSYAWLPLVMICVIAFYYHFIDDPFKTFKN
jgi:hypothetical protein